MIAFATHFNYMYTEVRRLLLVLLDLIDGDIRTTAIRTRMTWNVREGYRLINLCDLNGPAFVIRESMEDDDSLE